MTVEGTTAEKGTTTACPPGETRIATATTADEDAAAATAAAGAGAGAKTESGTETGIESGTETGTGTAHGAGLTAGVDPGAGVEIKTWGRVVQKALMFMRPVQLCLHPPQLQPSSPSHHSAAP